VGKLVYLCQNWPVEAAKCIGDHHRFKETQHSHFCAVARITACRW
jgi:hypothetical protein